MSHPSKATEASQVYVLPDSLLTLLTQYLEERVIPAIDIDPAQLAYRWVGGLHGHLQPLDVNLFLSLEDLQGIETQKSKLVQNTQQFLKGYPANHVLMTGTRGAGKSSLIRALLQAYHSHGLRIIEISRDDLQVLDKVRAAINKLPTDCHCRYVVYCDDLAFNGQDESYRALKSVLDGALDSEQDKLLVYGTSNRRRLLPQLMKDNVNIYDGQTDEVNPYEAIDETVSLSDRFGLWLSFQPMDQQTYLQIVQHYINLQQAQILTTDSTDKADNQELADDIRADAIRWAMERGGRSGRVAYQFSRHWSGKTQLAADNDF